MPQPESAMLVDCQGIYIVFRHISAIAAGSDMLCYGSAGRIITEQSAMVGGYPHPALSIVGYLVYGIGRDRRPDTIRRRQYYLLPFRILTHGNATVKLFAESGIGP